ncbi:hypothetical protein M1293_00270 [Candidatus Parvarchaeota archaeon]|nr:hypothetical protein [Candidatus Parvarchaeota archaeon]
MENGINIPDNGLYDLHAHISGSVKPETLFDLILRYRLYKVKREQLYRLLEPFCPGLIDSLAKESGYQEDDRRYFIDNFVYNENSRVLKKTMSNFKSILQRFPVVNVVLCNGRIRTEATEAVCVDSYTEGVRYLELRADPFSPVRAGTAADPVDVINEYVAGIENAMSKLDGFEANLTLGIAKQHYVDDLGRPDSQKIGNLEKQMEKIDEHLSHHRNASDIVVGIDAVNQEILPMKSLEGVFRYAREEMGLVAVPHAGESPRSLEEGLDNIMESIHSLHSARIGHGLAAIIDPNIYFRQKDDFGKEYTKGRIDRIIQRQEDVLDELKDSGVAVEINPTANIMVSDIKDFADHPIRKLMNKKIPVVIGTDDKGIFGKSLKSEIFSVSKAQNFSSEDVSKLIEDSKKYSIKNIR